MKRFEHYKKISNYAKLKGVARQYIYDLVKENKIPFIKIDDIVFIDERTELPGRKKTEESTTPKKPGKQAEGPEGIENIFID